MRKRRYFQVVLIFLIFLLPVKVGAEEVLVKNTNLLINAEEKPVFLYSNEDFKTVPSAVLNPGSAAYLIQERADSYQVASGTFQGYLKKNISYLKGKEAWKSVRKKKPETAVIQADTVFVYEKKERKGRITDLLSAGDTVDILNYDKEIIEIMTPQQTEGYISLNEAELKSKLEFAQEFDMETYASFLPNDLPTYSSEQEYNQIQENSEARGNSLLTGEQIVEYALQFVGNPYVWGGDSLTEGTDCSGFIKGVYEAFDIQLPRSSQEQRKSGILVCQDYQEALMKPGDLVFYEGHVALYIGNGEIVHAANQQEGIRISRADYRPDIICIRRVLLSRETISLTAIEKEMLCRLVEAEAAGEGLHGKRLVADVILNRLASPIFPNTIQEVIFQNKNGKYQFSPVKDGRYYSVVISKETKAAVEQALQSADASKGALYFMARSAASSKNIQWFDQHLVKLFQYGSHEFFR